MILRVMQKQAKIFNDFYKKKLENIYFSIGHC